MAPAKKSTKKVLPAKPTYQKVGGIGKEKTAYTRDSWLTWVFNGVITNPDLTLSDHSTEGIKLYAEMCRRDDALSMCFRKRAGNVIAQGWVILPGGETDRHNEIADYVTDVFNDTENFDAARMAGFFGIAYGYRPMEILFKRRADGRIGIDCIKDRDPARFGFDKKNNLVYTGQSNVESEEMPPWKFINNTWGSTESPYGQGLCRELYAKWFQKANANKIIYRYVEKLGTGIVLGTYPPGTDPKEQDNLYSALETLLSNSVAIMPEGCLIDLKEANHQGVVLLFQMVFDYVDDGYAKAILGQVLSTESEVGTHALAIFQSKGEQRLVEADSKWQMEQFDGLVHFLVDQNFGAQPEGEYPVFSIPFEENKDLLALAEAWLKLIGTGIEIPKDWAQEQIGIPKAEEGQEILVAPEPPRQLGPGNIEDADFDDVTPADKNLSEEADKVFMLLESLKKKPSAKRKATAPKKQQRT